MKLLIITQAVNLNNPALGFFHTWITALSKHVEFITVICLEKDIYTLPDNVRVLSLGKEEGLSRVSYLLRFYRYIITENKNYDAVFVHMNQEYVLLGGIFWFLLRKPIFMWRNHIKGDFFTYIAALLSKKIFYTSPFSFTSRFKKALQMPVGIDTDFFAPGNIKEKKDILFLSRLDPVKNPDVLIRALSILQKKDLNVSVTFAGSASKGNELYEKELKRLVAELGLGASVSFQGAIINKETPLLYGSHKLYVNCTNSGSFDKTILEAAACGSLVLVSNKSLDGEIPPGCIFEEGSPEDCAEKMRVLLTLSDEERACHATILREYVLQKHSLQSLVMRIIHELSANS